MDDLVPVVLITGVVVVLAMVAWWLGTRPPNPSSIFGVRKGPQPK